LRGQGGDLRARLLLALGAAAGAGLAAWGLLGSPAGGKDALPDGVVASVNGVEITRDAFAELVGAVATERRTTTLDDAERRRMLDRLVDEELLLQRGIALDLPRLDRTSRRAIVSAVIAAVTADAESAAPTEDELRGFLADEGERFRQPGRIEVEVLLAAVGSPPRSEPEAVAYRRAVDAVGRLRAGEPFERVRDDLGDPLPVSPPAGEITLDELRAALGPSAALAVEKLAPGETSDPVRGASGYAVVRLRRREAGSVPAFDTIRDQVKAEYVRSVGERALSDYLAELRSSADVRTGTP
jgi:hypothetical protein